MELKTMIVTSTNVPTDKKATPPYEFNAKYDGTYEKVLIVMPLGGIESGLFRYPKDDEKVLVGIEGSMCYLMGYLPSKPDNVADRSKQPFSPAGKVGTDDVSDMTEAEVIAKQGQVFRYKNTFGAGPNHSEINFQQQFDVKDNTKRLPDVLNITSAGFAIQNTEKGHSIQAKGIELLSGLDSNARLPGDPNKLAVGDAVGDVYALGGADIQFRAGGSIVIKAANKIVLQVGRSSITIDDGGIRLQSKKINSNWVNTFDTAISLNPRTGISMFGQTVGISAGNSLNMSDSWGGSFGSSAGAARVSGREVAVNTHDKLAYSLLQAVDAIDYGFNMSAVILAKNKEDPTYKANAEKLKFSYDFVKKAAQLASKIAQDCKKWTESWTKYKLERERQELLAQIISARQEAINAQAGNAELSNYAAAIYVDLVTRYIDTYHEPPPPPEAPQGQP